MTQRALGVVGLWLGMAVLAAGQEAPRSANGGPGAAPTARIQWYATWAQAKAEAERLERPILLQSAAPQCHGISGLW